jgi:hypothetical protein
VSPPLVAATTVEEGQPAVETVAPQAALEPPTRAGSGGADVVVVLDEDSAPPLPEGHHDVVMTSMSEPTPTARVPDPYPAAEVPEPSPAVGAGRLLRLWAPSPSKR